MLVVVRHASAGDRDRWCGDDRRRPLDARGRRQAARLPSLLAGTGVRRLLSSPYVRCVQTLEPLARELGLEIELVEELAEGNERRGFLELVLDEDAVACVHGSLRGAIGLRLPFPKGAVWIFEDALRDPRAALAEG